MPTVKKTAEIKRLRSKEIPFAEARQLRAAAARIVSQKRACVAAAERELAQAQTALKAADVQLERSREAARRKARQEYGVNVSFRLGEGGREAVAQVAKKRGISAADAGRLLLLYGALYMPKGWKMVTAAGSGPRTTVAYRADPPVAARLGEMVADGMRQSDGARYLLAFGALNMPADWVEPDTA